MSALVLTDAALWLDKYAFQGLCKSLALHLASDAKDATVFGQTSRAHLAGLKGFGLDASGNWDSALDLGLSGLLAGVPFTVVPLSSVAAIAYLGLADETDYALGAAIGEVLPFSLGLMGTGVLARGVLLANSTLAATANSSNSQIGALSATQSMYCNLHVPVVSGSSPTLDVIVQSDDNSGFSSPTTRATFTQLTAAGAAQKIIAGAITDDYWRFVFTIGGGSPSFAIGASMGRV